MWRHQNSLTIIIANEIMLQFWSITHGIRICSILYQRSLQVMLKFLVTVSDRNSLQFETKSAGLKVRLKACL